MKKLLVFGNRYAKQSTWKDFAMVKLCLFSMGLVVGTLVSEPYKKIVVGVPDAGSEVLGINHGGNND